IQQGPSDAVSSGEAVYQDTPDALSGGRFNPDPDAWREGYPYRSKLGRKDYERAKRQLQIEMLKMQLWSRRPGRKSWSFSRDVTLLVKVGPLNALMSLSIPEALALWR